MIVDAKIKMTDEQIQKLVDTNYRVLTLLGYATALIVDFKSLHEYHDQSNMCDWFLNAVNNVVYLNKPLPEFP